MPSESGLKLAKDLMNGVIMKTSKENKLTNNQGRVLPPLLLYLFGVPGIVCLLLWIFIWRGH